MASPAYKMPTSPVPEIAADRLLAAPEPPEMGGKFDWRQQAQKFNRLQEAPRLPAAPAQEFEQLGSVETIRPEPKPPLPPEQFYRRPGNPTIAARPGKWDITSKVQPERVSASEWARGVAPSELPWLTEKDMIPLMHRYKRASQGGDMTWVTDYLIKQALGMEIRRGLARGAIDEREGLIEQGKLAI